MSTALDDPWALPTTPPQPRRPTLWPTPGLPRTERADAARTDFGDLTETATSAPRAPARLRALPARSREAAFRVRLWCTGTILSVDPSQNSFQADLLDDKGTRSHAEIALDDVDPAERDWVVAGNRFTYVVLQEQRPTGLMNSDEIVVEPLREWTEADAARGAKPCARRHVDAPADERFERSRSAERSRRR